MNTPPIIVSENNGAKLNKNDILVNHYLESGLTVTNTAQKIGISRTQASLIKKKLNKFKVTNPHLLKKGQAVTKKVLDDFLNNKDNVRASDAIRIVEMQQDRIDPVKGNDSPNTVNFTVVNLALIQPQSLPNPTIIDIDNNAS